MNFPLNTFKTDEDLRAGVVFILDKPLEWTSFDVVNKIRFAIRNKLKVKKFKVGHAGTLDPLATGVLIICVGKMTKQIEGFMGEAKEYTGTIKLGATTPSYDLETEVDEEFPIDHITPEKMEEARLNFIGEQEQRPPIFSAKKVGGMTAYKAARKGLPIELKMAHIRIDEFEYTKVDLPEVDFRLACSKGTYVRSVAYDLGQKLDSGGHLTALRRIRSGDFTIDDALKVEEIVEMVNGCEIVGEV